MPSVSSPAYTHVLDRICEVLLSRAGGGLPLLLVDGVPACGKSTLALALSEALSKRGRQAPVVENDWFLGPQIRSPRAILGGLRLALSGQPVEAVEVALLRRFLDQERLLHFQSGLREAALRLSAGAPASIEVRGAWWNLARPRPFPPFTLNLQPGDVLIIEGTLSRAVYGPLFPDHTSVFVEIPVPEARRRFIHRDRRPETRRNLAFSMLARVGPAYRLASEMIGRDRHNTDIRVDLTDLGAPLLYQAQRRSV